MKNENTQTEEHTERALSIYLKGVLMGSADIVPGVSGGTMALITGIYERLIAAVASIGPKTLRVLKVDGMKAAWKSIDGTFLTTLALGIMSAVLTVSHLIGWALEEYPPVVWSFFFGLILASAVLIRSRVSQWNIARGIALVVGGLVGLGVSFLAPATTPNALWFVALSGAIAISAMILPGISGSFLLLLMGKYAYMLNAIRTMDIPTILVFLIGIAIGLMTGSRVIKVLFEKFHDTTMAAIIGIMLGSLYKVWPWKVNVTTYLDSDGIAQPVTQRNVLPIEYLNVTTLESYTVLSIVAFLVGLFLVVGIHLRTKQGK